MQSKSPPAVLSPAVPVRSLLLAASVLLLGACSSSSSENGTNSGNTAGNTSGGTTAGLPPLPSPPLTPAPSADDEPVVEMPELNSVSNFQIVRDSGEPLPETEVAKFTDADFDAGTPEPVIDVPSDVDPDTNSVPYFVGIANVEVEAGTPLEIVYKPLDDDGDVPGMFPNELPKGASFDDNFDGSKTFRWLPLQKDVGVSEFAVTAIDARNAQYRYTQAIRIRTVLPADPSTIPNAAPFLERLPDHEYTARVGDTVVIEFKGIDLNGTIPTIELLNPPAGSTYVAHPRRKAVYVLKYVPDAAGPQPLNLLIRDSVDTSLSTPETFALKVQDSTQPVRTGERLKNLAASRSIRFGYASSEYYFTRPDGVLYADVATSEFNLVTPEGGMKMNVINPLPGRYDWAAADNLVKFAKAANMDVHGHPLVWHRVLPEWILNAPKQNVEGHMREHIHRLLTRYKDDVTLWDVVNEPIADAGGFRDSVWFQAMGESYIDTALKQARETAPAATLLINEFDVEIPGPKADSFFTLLDRLKQDEIPLDGIGFQLHLFSSFDQIDDVRAAFARVAELDLDIYITELDVALTESGTNAEQANVFADIVGLCLEQPRCKAIQTWGFTDQYSFLRHFFPLLFDRNYQEKPSYSAIQQRLAQ